MKIESINGKEIEVDCIGCALQQGRIKALGGVVAQTENFEVQQDFCYPIKGFMIISSKKHIKGIEDLSKQERVEFIELLYRVRKALTEILNVKYISLHQDEDAIIRRESHFHFWLFPVHEWMKKIGFNIQNIIPIMEYAKENFTSKEHIDGIKQVAKKLKEYLSK